MEVLDSGAKRTGALLTDARTTAGLDLADIARETRVPLRHLRALETDRHDELPALPYAIGFVKAYARAVGLDAETVATQFRHETTKSAHVPTSLSLEPLDERRLPSRTVVVASLAAIVVIVVGVSAWGGGAFDAAPPPPTLAAAPDAVDADRRAPSADTATSPTNTAAGPAAATADPFGPPVSAVAATAPPPPVTGQVVLTAREDVWIKVYDRTSRANSKIGILKAGETYAVPADPPGLLLRTGKAGALAVTIAGRAIPPLGGPVETINDVSLAAADLAARTLGATASTDGPRPIATVPAANPPTPAPPASTLPGS